MKPANPILIVDDQRTIQVIIAKMLKKAGFDHVVSCTDERNAVNILENQDIEIILLDVIMPYISGEELLKEIRKKVPEIPVVMVTSQNDTATVVRCMRNGAYDYITKPIDEDLLVAAIERAIQFRELERQNLRLRNNLLAVSPSNKAFFEHIITGSSKMIALFKYCEAVAPGKEPVLITGETGTGKELMARAFHAAGQRKGPFVAVNVAGVDDHVFSDTLFGHEKGAFTGADRPRHGFINKAQGGTLFLVDTQSYGIAKASGHCCNTAKSIDSDGDRVPDNKDRCPDTPANVNVDGEGCPEDGDLDGVPDYRDKCPDTKSRLIVDANGCALDKDGDGVPNTKDQCPGTPPGIQVNDNGCPKPKPKATQNALVTGFGT
jgi:FixJ family two-component response regulator